MLNMNRDVTIAKMGAWLKLKGNDIAGWAGVFHACPVAKFLKEELNIKNAEVCSLNIYADGKNYKPKSWMTKFISRVDKASKPLQHLTGIEVLSHLRFVTKRSV